MAFGYFRLYKERLYKEICTDVVFVLISYEYEDDDDICLWIPMRLNYQSIYVEDTLVGRGMYINTEEVPHVIATEIEGNFSIVY